VLVMLAGLGVVLVNVVADMQQAYIF